MIKIKVANVILTTDSYTIEAKVLSVTLTVSEKTVIPLFFTSAKKNNRLVEVILDEYSFLPEHADVSGRCNLLNISANMDEIISIYREITKTDKYYEQLKQEKLLLPKDKILNDKFRELTLEYGKKYRKPSKKEFKKIIEEHRK